MKESQHRTLRRHQFSVLTSAKNRTGSRAGGRPNARLADGAPPRPPSRHWNTRREVPWFAPQGSEQTGKRIPCPLPRRLLQSSSPALSSASRFPPRFWLVRDSVRTTSRKQALSRQATGLCSLLSPDEKPGLLY